MKRACVRASVRNPGPGWAHPQKFGAPINITCFSPTPPAIALLAGRQPYRDRTSSASAVDLMNICHLLLFHIHNISYGLYNIIEYEI